MAEPAPDLEASSLLDSAWSEGVAGLRVMASDERLAARSRIASGALVLVLLAVSVFAVWSSQATSIAASRAAAASDLSDHYAQAASAI